MSNFAQKKQIWIQDNVHVLDCVWCQHIVTLPWRYPLSSAAQRIVMNLLLGMTLSQLKYKFQWKSSQKNYLVMLHWHKLGKWTLSLGIKSCHAWRNLKRLNQKEQQTKNGSSPHTPRQASASVHEPISVLKKTLPPTYSPAAPQILLHFSEIPNPSPCWPRHS